MRKSATICGVLLACLVTAAPALATPVATSDSEYDALGRVFPDPLATCSQVGAQPCSPNAQGNVPAVQFIQFQEFLSALEYMNTKPAWQRYMEVMVLDGKLGDNGDGEGVADGALGEGDTPGDAMFPGNDQPLEFDPKPEYRSAGLPTPTLERQRSDLVTIRVTDESVPDAGKERYALSLSIHGIERAGVEGGTRAAEDLITAATTGRDAEPVVPASVDPDAPSFAEVLKNTIIYFTYPNPDGWRRGSLVDADKGPGVFFQRYNGNGVDVNRDWPDIGFSFRPYSGLSEPESRALSGALTGIEESTGAEFAAGDDLHGQPFADALSYTLLPHGSHDFAKNERIRETAITIHKASEEALTWSPIVQPNDAPQGGGLPCSSTVPNGDALGDACAQIYGQTWGTVYDTINYTTTGALGDWFDSSIGLGADGIDNEMSFSHLDKNIVFDPHTEQLHVDGNKALIYAHLATIADPAEGEFDAPGTKAYVPSTRLTRDEKEFQPSEAPPGTEPQEKIVAGPETQGADLTVAFPFEVKGGPQPDGTNVYNGGMRVDITETNAQGIGTGNAATVLKVQCKGCDEHPGVTEDDEWVTVTEDYNQAPTYLQAGLTAAVNRPQAARANGTPVEWRALVDGPVGAAKMEVTFSGAPATIDGATGGDDPPRLAGYDVANSDFFEDLDAYIPGSEEDFGPVDPRAVIDGERSLEGIDSLVLADEALPGYTGAYGGGGGAPTGPPTEDVEFSGSLSVPGASSGLPGTSEDHPFTIGPDDANGKATVRIDWELATNDFDMFLFKVEENGDETLVGQSTNTQGETNWEEIVVENPAAGDYVVRVDNWLSADPRYAGSVKFEPPSDGGDGGEAGTGAFTVAEKDAWMAALREYAEGGGNLVLTDGALEALPDLADVPAGAVARQTVYAGQTAFATAADEPTLDDPLAADVDQEGARFGSGYRRQTFEPTPLGFAIQDAESGSDESNARQYDVSRAAWEAAGGRTAGTSVDSGTRNAQAVYDRVALGELPVGEGQIRIAGALLPQPSQEFDHTLGLEPYATTYTGYILARNLLEVEPGSGPDPAPPPGGGGSSGGGSGGSSGGGDASGDGGGGTLGNEPGEPKPGQGAGAARCERGDKGRDTLRGSAEDDCLKGRKGRDKLRGRRGDDRLFGGKGNDILIGGPGADLLKCGKGKRDRARADEEDTVRGCERLRKPKGV